MAIHFKKGLAKPLAIFLAAIGLGMFVLGLTLTIIGTLPGYSPYGGNPLKIVGPILLVLGVLVMAGVIVEWCVRTQKAKDNPEKELVDYSQSKATFHSSSLPKKKKEKYETPPLQTSTPGNNTHSRSSPAFRPHDILPQSQAKLAQAEPKERADIPNPTEYQHLQGRAANNGYNMPRSQPQKSAHFEPIHQAPVSESVPYAQVMHPQRQQSSSSGNYFFPTVTNPTKQQHIGFDDSKPSRNGSSNGNGKRWGNSKENLDDAFELDSKNELPVLDIVKDSTRRSRGKGSGQDKNKPGPGDKYSRTGSYRAANTDRDGGRPSKSPRSQRRGYGESTGESHRYPVDNPGYTRERAIDVDPPSQSTPKERDGGGYSSHNTSREAPAASSNFSRRNSSRTRRGSKRRPRGERGDRARDRERSRDRDHDRSRDREHERSRDYEREHRERSRERPRERSSSRGRLGLDDSTTLDYVRGVPIDKDSRRKSSGRPQQESESERQHHHHHHPHSHQPHHRDREGDARRNYESDDAHIRKHDSQSTSPSDMSHPSSKQRHSGYSNNAFEDDRALSPKMSPEDFLNSKQAKDAKNMNFTININAQPGAAVQIALGSQNLPTPKPMITATPMKTEVRTNIAGLSD